MAVGGDQAEIFHTVLWFSYLASPSFKKAKVSGEHNISSSMTITRSCTANICCKPSMIEPAHPMLRSRSITCNLAKPCAALATARTASVFVRSASLRGPSQKIVISLASAQWFVLSASSTVLSCLGRLNAKRAMAAGIVTPLNSVKITERQHERFTQAIKNTPKIKNSIPRKRQRR